MIHLNWIKGHSNQTGNDLADRAANRGADLARDPDNQFHIPVSYGFIKAKVKEVILFEWNIEYRRTDLSQIKLWFPEVNLGPSRIVKSAGRQLFSRIVRWTTGHVHLNRQNNLVDPDLYPDPMCRRCGLDLERAIHIIGFCAYYTDLRRQYFGCSSFVANQRIQWSMKRLVGFLTEYEVYSLEHSQEDEISDED